MIKVSGSIVLYNNNKEILQQAIFSFLNCEIVEKLYLIDNSPTNELEVLSNDQRIEYIHNPSNPGFGAAHNVAIKKSINANFQYHFIVNPDVYFSEDVISKMVNYASEDQRIGMLMPQVLNLDGTVQNLPKLLPSPFSILLRKIKRPKFIYESFIIKYELRNINSKIIYEAPILSGCFTLLNINAIKEVGMYDDRFFMYFEDWDLSRRVNEKYKTIYYPLVSVYHGYESGANKSSHLFKIFVKSYKYYFNKWGWFFDKDRHKVNEKTLDQFK